MQFVEYCTESEKQGGRQSIGCLPLRCLADSIAREYHVRIARLGEDQDSKNQSTVLRHADFSPL